ncbi:hypothetical protein BDZ91DRAFT_796017 [Kalaharituber pfeilii]|nr:hypothetical protein BDZ91DRAFT_796017 [Kalaharituber pfeilii]
MLLPLSSSWPRESLDCGIGTQFNVDVDSYDGSATVSAILVPSRSKPTEEDSFSPPQVLSDSTFSLLSRKYSPSTTDSSCECSERSSVDENFHCGSESPIIGPINWDENSESCSHTEEMSAGNSDGDDKQFSLLSLTPDSSMIIPPTGVSGIQHSSLQQQTQLFVTETNPESLVGDKPEGYCKDKIPSICESGFTGVPNEDEDWAIFAAIAARDTLQTTTSILPPATTSSSQQIRATQSQLRSVPEDLNNNSSCATETITASTVPFQPKLRRSSFSTSSPHACPTCHLYAPSTSQMFYLDAWLNQQNDIHPQPSSAGLKSKPRKRVSWPSTTSELKTIIQVSKWIEKGVHVHPHPAPRSARLFEDDTEDDLSESEEDDYESKRVRACEKEEGRISVRMKQDAETCVQLEGKEQCETQTVASRDSDSESTSSVVSVRWDGSGGVNPRCLENALQELNLSQSQSSSRSSSSSSLSSASSSSSTSGSLSPSSVTIASQSIPNHPKSCKIDQNSKLRTIPSYPRPPIQSTQSLSPRKKYSSGVKVTVIGGPYSEHEAAVRIRGMDPIKHRAMIENYWQY